MAIISMQSVINLVRIVLLLEITDVFSKSTGFHLYMSKQELARYFGTDDHEEVPDYEVVYPKRMGQNEESKREKTNYLHFNIKAFGDDFNLHLKRNDKLLAKDMRVEFLGQNGKILRKEKVKDCFYHGHSKNHPTSKAAITTCNNLAGAIHTNDQSYYIEPLPKHIAQRYKRAQTNAGTPHIIYKSGSSRMRRHAATKNSKNREHFCGTEDNPRLRHPRDLENDPELMSTDVSKDPERYIETLIVVDENMCAFHGEDAVKQFALAACNIAAGLLKDSTIGTNPINLVITKMQIHTTPQDGFLINNHAMNSLSNFGRWAERNTVPDDTDPQHYDYATLFTRTDICKDKNQPCETLGVTNVGGMCRFPNSVSICEDNGLTIGRTLAHETGHSLGMNHDRRPFCGDSKKIMSWHPEGKDAYKWSKCSRMFLKQFLDSSKSRCLEDRPTTRETINLQVYNDPGLLYSADQQCALAFGNGAKYCEDTPSEEICSQLWCSIPYGKSKDCQNLNEPLADGTVCGELKRCKQGVCVSQFTEDTDAVNGGWSDWSPEYTECTRSCSGGVQYRTRQCNNPLPTNGGKFCEGENREYRLCNTKKCTDKTDFRMWQCKQKNLEMFNDKFFEWEWRPSNLMNKCTLGCFIKNTNQGYAFGNVEDGTNCETDFDGKCVNGECMRIGCDDVIGSSAKLDRCGVCNGDGNSCRYGNGNDNIIKAYLKEKYEKQGESFNKTLKLLQNMGYNISKSLNLNINEVVSDFNWAIMKSGCSVTCGGGIETTTAECRRSDDGSPATDEKCEAKNKPTEKRRKCNTKPCEPEWRAERWSDCTKTCNGGKRTRHVKCIQMVDGSIEYDIEDELCAHQTKPTTTESCNTHECRPEWVVEPFGACSTSCGQGLQTRNVTCRKVNTNGETVDLEEERCAESVKPQKEEFCNVHNPCPGEGECGGKYTTNKGFITSPGFPSNYPLNKECVHVISVDEDKLVKLVFESFDLEDGGGKYKDGMCGGDFVKVVDGECHDKGSETRYCGNKHALPFVATGNKLCVKFFSDDSKTGSGFNASFEAVDPPAMPRDMCGSTITTSTGMVTSPNYPEPYPANEVCNVTIRTLEGPIAMNFQYFDVGEDESCDENYLLVKGDQYESKFCGSNKPNTYNVTGNTIKLSFKSGQQNEKNPGFVASYISGKDNKDLENNKVIESYDTRNSSDEDIKTLKSIRDTIARPQSKRNISVSFLPIPSNSLDRNEVAKEEVSSISSPPTASSQSLEKQGQKTNETKSAVSDSTKFKIQNDTRLAKQASKKTLVRPLQSVLEQSGSLITRGECPHPSRLSCLNVLYSYPCQDNRACQLRGMDCCPTSCSYGPSMCVPKVWRECPLMTPYVGKIQQHCVTTADCGPNQICCIDMLARRYCHEHEATDK